MSALDQLLDRIAASDMAPDDAVAALAASEPAWEPCIPLLSAHLAGGDDERIRSGAFYTPPALVDFLVEQTLGEWCAAHPGKLPTILDPTCGTGRFLLRAGSYLTTAIGGDPREAWRSAGPLLRGYDLDPLAVAWTRGRIIELAGETAAAAGVQCIDALDPAALPSVEADVILGNPPFGTPLKQPGAERVRQRAGNLTPTQLPPYVDQAAVFLLLSAQQLRAGGRLGMVQPLSFLAARDASTVRAAISSTLTLEYAWASDSHEFDAMVHTCALGFVKGPGPAKVNRFHSIPIEPASACASAPCGNWCVLAAPAFEIPDLPSLGSSGVIGDIAIATADFRDQYYGLQPAMMECDGTPPEGVAPIATTGLIDPGVCHWHDRDTRLFKRRWRRPAVRLADLSPRMQTWAESRLKPKVMLPTQTRVLEPFLDQDGAWLPSVPIISITSASGGMLERIAALLASPIAALLALHWHLGTARSPHAIKLAARDVHSIPTPAHDDRWDQAAAHFARAQGCSEQQERLDAMKDAASAIHRAFDIPPEVSNDLIEWWLDRLPRRTRAG